MQAALSPATVTAVKLAVAAAAAALFLVEALGGRALRGGRARRICDVALAALGVLGALCWTNLLQLHYPHWLHRHDTFHYYLGAKYFDELGYTHLYECSAAVDLEAGRAQELARRRLRDLETNLLVPARSIVADPSQCRRRFTAERWQAFRADVAHFRSLMTPNQWARMHLDHGYNPSPVWGLLGGLLTRLPGDARTQLPWLTALDPLLLAAMWAAVAWAFGWRTLCVGLIFWGTSAFAHFAWVGGAYLRHAWLAAMIGGLCLLRRDRALAAGFLLAWASLLRIFPAFVLLGLGLAYAIAVWRSGSLRPPRAALRLATGCALALAVLLPASLVFVGGLESWRQFAENSVRHAATPLTNDMGLRVLLAYDPAESATRLTDESAPDPTAAWRAEQERNLAERRWLYWAGVVAFCGLLGRAAWREEPWVVGALAFGAVPVLGKLACYYYSGFVALALLRERTPVVAVALSALAASSLLFVLAGAARDTFSAWMSAGLLATLLVTLLALGRARPEDDGESSEPRGSAPDLEPAGG